MTKYLWYSVDLGLSDDFNTQTECENDAKAQAEEYNCEVGIYAYESEEHPNGEVEIDDCAYISFIH